MIQKVTSEIFIVGGDNSGAGDAAVYLMSTGTGAVLIDAGTGRAGKRVLANIIKTGVDPSTVRYIFLTHCHFDHTGGAAELKRATGARIVAHELDAVYIENADPDVTAASWYGCDMEKTAVDIKIKGVRQEFVVDEKTFEVCHIPGHSPGSCAITVYSDDMLVLFGQDVHGPLHPGLKSDRAFYRKSLEFMASLNADILCEGHYGVFRGKQEVKSFILSFLK